MCIHSYPFLSVLSTFIGVFFFFPFPSQEEIIAWEILEVKNVSSRYSHYLTVGRKLEKLCVNSVGLCIGYLLLMKKLSPNLVA